MPDAPPIDPPNPRCSSTSTTARSSPAASIPAGRYVFFGAEDNLVHRFDLQPRPSRRWPPTIAGSAPSAARPSGDVLYSGGYDGRLDLVARRRRKAAAASASSRPIRAGFAPSPSVPTASESPPAATTTSSSSGTRPTASSWPTLAGHASHVYNVAFHPSGETLVSCDLKGVLKEWDVAAGTLKRDLTPAAALYKYDTTFRADIGGARSIAFRTDGKQLAVGGITNVTNAFAGIGNPAIVLARLAEGKVALQLEAKEKINGVAWGVAHHPDGFWIGLAGGGGGGWLYFWKDVPMPAPDAKPAATIRIRQRPPNPQKRRNSSNSSSRTSGRDLDLHPDNLRLAVAHADGNLRLYNLYKKQ